LVTITKRANTRNASGQIKVIYGASTGTSYAQPVVGQIRTQPLQTPYPQNSNRKVNSNGWNGLGNAGYPVVANATKRQSYHTFTGITIPQGSIINSAIITFYTRKFSPAPIMQVNVVDALNGFTIPLGPSSFWNSAQTVMSKFLRRTATVGSKTTSFMQTTPTGTKREKATFQPFESVGYNFNWLDVRPANPDVTNLVQRLVDQFDYNNDKMMFTVEEDFPNTKNGFPPNSTNKVSIYTHYIYSGTPFQTTKLPLAGGTPTSQGTSALSPKLVIDYTAPAPATTSDFTVDAIPLLAPYLRSCTKQDAILISTGPPPPPHIGFEVAEAILDYLTTNGDKTGFELLAEVINPTTGRPYTNHAIKNSIGWLQSTNQITGNPYVPPLPEPGGSFNFKKTTWTIV
jgi:hypothetical protein